MEKYTVLRKILLFIILVSVTGCSAPSYNVYHDPVMDFQAVQTVAVMPFNNLTREQLAADRVRDVFTNMLLATREIYVVPPGEVTRGALIAGIADPVNPSPEEIVKLAAVIKVDAVITGVVREYGEVRAGTSTGNIISISMRMIEGQTGKVVWSAAVTKGGITVWDRLFGGGGEPMNDITEEAVNEIINKYF